MNNTILSIVHFLLGSNNKLGTIADDLYKGDWNLLDISDYFPFERKVHVAAFNLQKFTLDLIDNSGTVKSTIEDIEKNDPSKYICFINGPFFNYTSKPGTIYSIGRRKGILKHVDTGSSEFIPVDQRIQDRFPACVYTDHDDRLYIESFMADAKLFDRSKRFFESTPLFIDVDHNINNFTGDISSITEKGILADNPTVEKGMPFIGLSEYKSNRYFTVIMIGNSQTGKPKYNFKTLFGYLSAIAEKLEVKKLVFTDGSDSAFLKVKNTFHNDEMGPHKNLFMPFFIGIRKLNNG